MIKSQESIYFSHIQKNIHIGTLFQNKHIPFIPLHHSIDIVLIQYQYSTLLVLKSFTEANLNSCLSNHTVYNIPTLKHPFNLFFPMINNFRLCLVGFTKEEMFLNFQSAIRIDSIIRSKRQSLVHPYCTILFL